MNRFMISVLYASCLLLGVSCAENGIDTSPANLVVKRIKLKELDSYKTLNIPPGVYIFDNPDFDFNDPDTWTGDVEQFVDYYYKYSVSFVVSNRGGMAYDTEVDLYYTHDDGSESTATIYVGDILPNERTTETTKTVSVNSRLIGCEADVFWYD